MIVKRICTALAALALPAALLSTQAPTAYAVDGPCPDYMHMQGESGSILTREDSPRYLGDWRAKYNYTTKYWCIEVASGGRLATIKAKYNGDVSWRAEDTGTDGMVHVWLKPNADRKCVWVHGFIYTTATNGGYLTDQRCHA